MTNIVNLTDLTDDDLACLERWCDPVASVERHPAVAAWGRFAWRAVIEEQQRREGREVELATFPGFDDLSDTELSFLGPLIYGLRDLGSVALHVWSDDHADMIVGELADRAIRRQDATE